jgi:hypothetical protein
MPSNDTTPKEQDRITALRDIAADLTTSPKESLADLGREMLFLLSIIDHREQEHQEEVEKLRNEVLQAEDGIRIERRST